jgi:alginate O-acetyltransferase complex protein AlgI
LALTQIEFPIIVLATLAFLRANGSDAYRKVVILAVSYYFYACWDYRFLYLLLIPSVVDYTVARLAESESRSALRKAYLSVSVCTNLGILCLFKYYDFFIATFRELVRPMGFAPQSLNLILPIGISFYTFKSLGYVIDVYRKKVEASHSLLDYAVFVSFFPTIVAGPILRAGRFLPQLQSPTKGSFDDFAFGARRFVIGLFKKVFIADRLGMFVDPFFANAAVYDWSTAWLAVTAYTVQIYLDFSGYSDMAIGVSRAMGFHIEENFNFPYLSKSIGEFWRRWHISLSSWIRDYVYISLGGNRRGTVRTYLNVLLSMALCGLWHGAGWTFIVWGLYQGCALAVHRAWHGLRISGQGGIGKIRVESVASWFLTTVFVVVGRVFFRSDSLDQAWTILGRMFGLSSGLTWYHPFVVGACAAVALFHIAESLDFLSMRSLPLSAPFTLALLLIMLALVVLFYPEGFHPFVYAKF